MKLTGSKLNPKNLFRSKKQSSSFNSSSSASPESRSFKSNGVTTPTSVLPPNHTSSDSLSELSGDLTSNITSSDQFESKSFNSNGVPTPTSVSELSGDIISLSETSGDVQYDLIEAFRLIDGDGRITRSDLTALLSRIGVSTEEISLMIDEIDSEGDGSISLEEFGVISSVFGTPVSCDDDDEIRCAFEFFDTDRDGLITADELYEVFELIGGGECTLEDCKRMIRSVDMNRDGFVCFEDFRRMMEQQDSR